ncbi:MAG: polyprenyl synthetase family protein [Bacteroidales bacterium]|nr:polyprenyl synthetase family protein [Bacteroidales bacterium]
MKEFAKYKALIDKALDEIMLPAEPKKLYEPISYTFGVGGKRLRPILTLAACELFGGIAEDAVEAAVGLEIFHNFTLLHDDIMDKAPLRRGKETVFKKWNSNVAILSGDTMFALTYRYLAAKHHPRLKELLDTFTQTAIEVCEGQQYDMDFETRPDVTIAEYINMIRMKTAVLLGASLKIGALISQAEEEQAGLLYDFGINVGIAFQLKDDLLDTYGTEEKFGKSIGGDILANKKTFLYLKCFEVASNEDRANLINLYSFSSDLPPGLKIKQVMDIYNRYNIKDEAIAEMGKFFGTAIQVMNSVKADRLKKNVLVDYAEWLYKRDH